MIQMSIGRRGFLGALLVFLMASNAVATTRTSMGNGRWENIEWFPAGVPESGDTVVVTGDVTGMPAGDYRSLVLLGGARLSIEAGTPRVERLVNSGTLVVGHGAWLEVTREARNDGVIEGEGLIDIVGSGAALAGDGAFGALRVSAPGAFLNSYVTIARLHVVDGVTLDVGPYLLTVTESFTSYGTLDDPGVRSSGGLIQLGGDADGSASGEIEFVDMVQRRHPPTVHGVFGGSSVRFLSSRRIILGGLVGDVSVAEGVRLHGTGFGANGASRIDGDLVVEGTLSADDDAHRWIVAGDVTNGGTIEHCTLVMTHPAAMLNTTEGTWAPTTGLLYRSSSGGRLTIDGTIVSPSVTIEPAGPLDSNVAVVVRTGSMRVRHRFTSAVSRACRLVSSSPVSIWGASDGAVEGSVFFEGFWGYPISGRYGNTSGVVEFRTPKRIVGPLHLTGAVIQAGDARLTIDSSVAIDGETTLQGDVWIRSGASVTIDGDLLAFGTLGGGGEIVLTEDRSMLNVLGSIEDSVSVTIGRDRGDVRVAVARSVCLPRLRIANGGNVRQLAGVNIHALRFEHLVRYDSGRVLAAPACHPSDNDPASVYAGAIEPIERHDGSAYLAADSIVVGVGNRVTFPAESVVEHRGTYVGAFHSIAVHTGWNLVGGPSYPVRVQDITTNDCSFTSPFYSNDGRTIEATELLPGRGYWVLVAGEGTITFGVDE